MDVFDLYATISIKLDDFEKGLNDASSKFKSFSSNLSKVGSGMKDLLNPAVEGFKAVESVGQTAGSAIKKGLTGFAAASTAVAGFGTAAVKSGMQFDATMSEVSAISGATGEDFDALRDKALEMGAKTKFSASEAGEAMTYMAMAGWKAEDMIGGIEGIMNLAAASGEDLATTSDIVTDALTAFGMSASDSGHFADVMAIAASNANTNVSMMGETFKYVAPVAGALGYSVDDTALAIGLMANSGIKATQAGTSLRSIFTRLSTDAGASSTSLGALGVLTEKLGVQFYNTDGSARELNDVLMDSRAAWAGLTEEQQISYAKTIAGQEAMSGWLALMNASADDVNKLTDAIIDCNGAAKEMADTMVDNLQGDLTLLGSAFESLQIAISDSLTPTLREFAKFGQKAMAGLLEGFQGGGVSGFMTSLSGIATDGVTMLAEKAPEFASVSLQFVGALADGILGARFQIFEAGNNILVMFAQEIPSWLSSHTTELQEFGTGILRLIFQGFLTAGDIISENIGQFIPLIANAFALYHEALFTVGIEILGAIGQGIVENKDELQYIASDTITNMVTALRDSAPAIIEGGLALLEALVGAIEENLPLILETGGEIVGRLIEGISKASPGVQAIIATAVLPFIGKIIDVIGNIGGAVQNAWGLIKKVIDLVSGGEGIEKIIAIGKKLVSGIQALFTLIMAHPVIAVITAIIAALVLLWTNCEEFRDIVKGVLEAVGGFFKLAYEVITGAFAGAVEFFGGVVDGIKGVFDGIGEFLGGLFSAAWELVQGAWDVAVSFFTEIGNGIQLVFEAVTFFLGEAFSTAWSAITAVWEAAVGFFSGIWEGISSAGSAAAELVTGALNGAWDAITSAWDGALNFFSGIYEDIIGAFSSIVDDFLGIGKNIVQGIWDGISGAWGSFMSWLEGKVGGIISGVKSMLGIHSPSTVFAGIGENMALGLAEGWGDQYNSIKRQIENGLSFGMATVGLSTNGTYTSSGAVRNGNQIGFEGGGSFTVNIYNPEKRDAVTEAREWKKTAQRMAMGYV